MKLPSSDEMRKMDAATIAAGISELDLMERAGDSLFRLLIEIHRDDLESEKPVLVLAGPGNNGGDGLVVARLLIQNGYGTKLVITEAQRYSECFLKNLGRFIDAARSCGLSLNDIYFGSGDKFSTLRSGIVLPKFIDPLELKSLVTQSDLVIDALLGIGIKGAPTGYIATAISAVSEFAGAVVSLDVPSGINADTGEVYSPAIVATTTLTVELIKRGMVQYPAKANCGHIEIARAGIDTSIATEFCLIDNSSSPVIPERHPRTHKSDYGQVLVVGGCATMPGAPVLSAMACLRGGAGIVTLAVPYSDISVKMPPEIMHLNMPERSGVFTKTDLPTLEAAIQRHSVIVFGPGLGQEPRTEEFVSMFISLISKVTVPVVIDADALNIISKTDNFDGKPNWIYTPHPGEAARLLGQSTIEIESNRYLTVRQLHQKLGGVVVLKGASSIIYYGETGYVNQTGNPYMATAGSGDVLCGVIAALLAQGLNSLDSAKVGTYIHGMAGDIARKEKGRPLIATDIIESIPAVLK